MMVRPTPSALHRHASSLPLAAQSWELQPHLPTRSRHRTLWAFLALSSSGLFSWCGHWSRSTTLRPCPSSKNYEQSGQYHWLRSDIPRPDHMWSCRPEQPQADTRSTPWQCRSVLVRVQSGSFDCQRRPREHTFNWYRPTRAQPRVLFDSYASWPLHSPVRYQTYLDCARQRCGRGTCRTHSVGQTGHCRH